MDAHEPRIYCLQDFLSSNLIGQLNPKHRKLGLNWHFQHNIIGNLKLNAFQISEWGKISEFKYGWIWNAENLVTNCRFWVKNLNSIIIRNLTNTEYLYFKHEFHTHIAVIGTKFYEETSQRLLLSICCS